MPRIMRFQRLPMSIMHTDERARFYETFADDFDAKMNRYDLERRLEIIFD